MKVLKEIGLEPDNILSSEMFSLIDKISKNEKIDIEETTLCISSFNFDYIVVQQQGLDTPYVDDSGNTVKVYIDEIIKRNKPDEQLENFETSDNIYFHLLTKDDEDVKLFREGVKNFLNKKTKGNIVESPKSFHLQYDGKLLGVFRPIVGPGFSQSQLRSLTDKQKDYLFSREQIKSLKTKREYHILGFDLFYKTNIKKLKKNKEIFEKNLPNDPSLRYPILENEYGVDDIIGLRNIMGSLNSNPNNSQKEMFVDGLVSYLNLFFNK